MGLKKIKNTLKNASGKVADKAKEGGIKAVEIGEKVVESTTSGLANAAEKVQESSRKLQVEHYSPLFPEEFRSPDFDLPNMIVIVDEDVRKGIEVCKGAVGWLSKHSGLEVLHLYSEAVADSGLVFFPVPMRGSAYYVDQFDAKRYVNLKSFFGIMQRDKITEIRNIAYALGAKHCQLELYEEAREKLSAKTHLEGKVRVQTDAGPASFEKAYDENVKLLKDSQYSVLFSQSWEGDAVPVRPELKWFEHDREIQSLIEMRLLSAEGKGNATKSYRISIDSSTSMTMEGSHARKVEAALKHMGFPGGYSIAASATREYESKMVLELEF